MKLFLALAAALAALAGGAAYAYAMQADATSAELRATGLVGEQWNGYMGLVGSAPSALVKQMNDINVRRRAYYTDLAKKRGVTIQEVGATMACEIFADAVLPGQYYRLPDGVWRRRQGNAPVQRPPYCV